MRKFIIVSLCLLATIGLSAQDRYAVRASFYGGKIIPLSENLKKIATGPVLGAEVNFEFLPQGDKNWEQFWGYPTWGVGLLMLDMGNPQLLGQSFSIYPYLLVPIVKTDYFQMNYKIGAGVSFFTKTWNRGDTLSGVNAATANSAIGSIMNAYLTTGVNFEVPIRSGFSATAEVGYSHMSNGSILQPNGGLNIIYAELGAKYYINWRNQVRFGRPNPTLTLPYDFAANFTVSGGSREHYYADNKSYPVGSLHIGATYVLAPFYALGAGLDAFYDGAFVQQGRRDGVVYDQYVSRSFNRYFIENNNFENKMRVGLGINNEFIMGRVTALLDWGVYLWDPLRNANPEPHKKHGYNRPMFYSYDINKEDGWNYFRLGARVRVWDNLYVQVSMKTHLQKAEMIEFGVGYRIPFMQVDKYSSINGKRRYWIHHPEYKEPTAFPTPWK